MAPKTPAVVDSSGSDASDVEGADFIPGDEFVHRQQATVYDAVAGMHPLSLSLFTLSAPR